MIEISSFNSLFQCYLCLTLCDPIVYANRSLLTSPTLLKAGIDDTTHDLTALRKKDVVEVTSVNINEQVCVNSQL